MKGKGLVVGAVAVAVIVVAGIFMLSKPKPAPATAQTAVKAKGAAVKPGMPPAAPVKKAISKDMGALTVKVSDAKGKDAALRIRAFRAVDSRSSVLAGAFVSNRTQELAPGSYDIEIETAPVKIYKGINVAKGRETVEDLGRVTGSVEVKAAGVSKKPAAYPVRVMFAKSTTVVASGVCNRPIDVIAGSYDIEIGSAPKQFRKDVKVEGGKEAVIDIGGSGAIMVKAVDEAGKASKGSVRIKKSENSEPVTTAAVNKLIELMPGSYMVESAANPAIVKKDVKVAAQEEVTVELVIPEPLPPAPRPAPAVKPAAAKTAAPAPVKK